MTPIYNAFDELLGYIEKRDDYWVARIPNEDSEATEAVFKTRLAAVRWLHRQATH